MREEEEKWEFKRRERVFCRIFPSHKNTKKLLLPLCLWEWTPESELGTRKWGWGGGSSVGAKAPHRGLT